MNWLSSLQGPVAGSAPSQALALTKAKVSYSGSTPSQFHALGASSDLRSSKRIPALYLGISLLAHSPVLETEFLLFLHLLGLKFNLALNLITFAEALKNFLGSQHFAAHSPFITAACRASSCVASFPCY